MCPEVSLLRGGDEQSMRPFIDDMESSAVFENSKAMVEQSRSMR